MPLYLLLRIRKLEFNLYLDKQPFGKYYDRSATDDALRGRIMTWSRSTIYQLYVDDSCRRSRLRLSEYIDAATHSWLRHGNPNGTVVISIELIQKV